MTEIERICDQFRRAYDGHAWHGPSVLNLLEGISATQAAAQPIPSAHSIWQLVNHIAAWERACLRRLNGDPAQLSDEEDWAPINDTGESAWEKTKQDLVATHEDLLKKIATLDDSQLDDPIIENADVPFSTIYITLHGGVQHDLYHAGQIAVLKKALS